MRYGENLYEVLDRAVLGLLEYLNGRGPVHAWPYIEALARSASRHLGVEIDPEAVADILNLYALDLWWPRREKKPTPGAGSRYAVNVPTPEDPDADVIRVAF